MSWWDKEIPEEIAEVLITLKIKINGKQVTRDWRKDCGVDYDRLEDDLENMSSIYSFWTAVLAEARKNLRVVEYDKDIRKSKIMRSIVIPEGVKLTVADKENIVNVDPEMGKLIVRHIELENLVQKLFGIVDSLKMKADNLRSLAGFKRAELSGS
ncbi:MAG: hypothetical protein M0P71_13795 [Melioribacteraceae bacterium]|nr:hypothetical protein [Melioribacteraceae bacterium]